MVFKKLGRIICIMGGMILLSALNAYALEGDTIYLHDGSSINGEIIESVPGVSFTLKRRDGTIHVFKMAEVWKVKFEEEEIYEDRLYLKNGSVIIGTIIGAIPAETYRIRIQDKSILVFQMEEVERVELKTPTPVTKPQPPVITPPPSPQPSISAPSSRRIIKNINLFWGAKTLDEENWEPAHEQREIGFGIDIEREDLPVNIVIEYLRATGEGTAYLYIIDYDIITVDAESKTSELNIGIQKVWRKSPRFRPFIEGGVSLIQGELRVTALGVSGSDSDSAFGLWLGGGLYWTFGNFNIGFEIKGSSAEVELFDVNCDAGGGHFGILLGYHW